MDIALTIGEWLLVIALIGALGAFVWLIVAILNFKNVVILCAKSLYERPLQSVKNIMATGKGIGQQEAVRLRHITARAKTAAGSVQETVAEVKMAADSVRSSDMKPILANIQNAVKLFELAAGVARAAGKQKA